MANDMDDWRPDVDVPRDYPPPQRLWLGGVSPTPDVDAAQRAAEQRVNEVPREMPDLEPLRRCLADVEAAAQRLRALLERLEP